MATVEELKAKLDPLNAEYQKLLAGDTYEQAIQKATRSSNYDFINRLDSAKASVEDITSQIYTASFAAHNDYRKEQNAILKAKKAADTAGAAKAKEDVATAAAREAEDKRRRAAGGGVGSTVLTSPLGLPPQPQNVKRKTLLGQ